MCGISSFKRAWIHGSVHIPAVLFDVAQRLEQLLHSDRSDVQIILSKLKKGKTCSSVTWKWPKAGQETEFGRNWGPKPKFLKYRVARMGWPTQKVNEVLSGVMRCRICHLRKKAIMKIYGQVFWHWRWIGWEVVVWIQHLIRLKDLCWSCNLRLQSDLKRLIQWVMTLIEYGFESVIGYGCFMTT